MKIHEYQAKEIFRDYNVRVPDGKPAFTVADALSAYDTLDSETVVVKAQIHAGGRGKGGGVKLAHSRNEVEALATQILGMNLVTHQTGPEGKEVQRLLIETGIDIAEEFYAGIVLDRKEKKFVFMVSTEGGVEIEKVAAETPEKIIKEWIHPENGLTAAQATTLAQALGLQGAQLDSGVEIFTALWAAFIGLDCSLMEINPLVVTGGGELMALDAKVNFDDSGLFRYPAIRELRDISEEDPAEVRAGEAGLSYVQLDGSIGCLGNGAGLAAGDDIDFSGTLTVTSGDATVLSGNDIDFDEFEYFFYVRGKQPGTTTEEEDTKAGTSALDDAPGPKAAAAKEAPAAPGGQAARATSPPSPDAPHLRRTGPLASPPPAGQRILD